MSAPAPLRMTPKAAAAMAVLAQGVKVKHIRNVDYEEASQTVSRGFQDAADAIEGEVRTACRRTDPDSSGLYGITDTLSYLTSVNKIVKDYEKWLKNPKPLNDRGRVTPEMISGAREMIDFARSWVPVLELKKQAKFFIVKGRKPSDKPAEERYVPPMSSQKSLAKVEKVLRDLVESKRTALERMRFESLWATVVAFFKLKKSPYRFFLSEPRMIQLVEKLVTRPASDHYMSVNWAEAEMRPDAYSIVEGVAKKDAQSIVDNYVKKNLAKLTRPVAEREAQGGKLVEIRDLGMTVRGDTFAGWMQLRFSDDTGFKVLNQLVHKRSSRGWPFEQYPTTFHEVLFRGGVKKAKQSEEQMNNDWLVV